MNDLPTGWRQATLREVCKPVSKVDPVGLGRTHFQYVDIGSIESGALRVTSPQTLAIADAPGRARQLLASGDTVFSTVRPYLKKIAWVPAELDGEIASTGFCVLRPKVDVIHPRFLFHFATSDGLLDQVLPLQRGVSYPAVRDGDVFTAQIPLPPIDEQRRIVAILEDHLSRLDASTGSLSHSRSMVGAMQRRAMVSLLAEDGDDMELNGVLTQSIGGLWGEVPGDSELDVRVIRVTEMGRLGALNSVAAATRSITKTQYASRALRPGDLLLEKSGGGPTTPVGRVGLVRDLEEPSICSNFMQLMRPDIERVHPRWLHLYLNAYHLSGRTNAMQKASTNIRNIKASEYLKIPIKVPRLDRQGEVIAITEAWLDAAARLAEALDASLRRGSALRRSLLASAFSGRLTKEFNGV